MAQFNPTENEVSLYADALFWSGATTDTFPVDPDFTRSANFALDQVTVAIQKSDSTWEWADSNESAELIDGTTALTANVAKYAIALSWLKITRVRIKDQNGNWRTLDPIDRRQLSDSNLASTGTPWGYYKLGNFIYLVGAPNYSLASALEVQFQKGADYFEVSDTTKEPGFAPQFHRLVSLYSALDWCEANEMEQRSAMIRNRIGRLPDPALNDPGAGMLRELALFYSSRDNDQAPAMTLQREDYGSGSLSDDFYQNPRGF